MDFAALNARANRLGRCLLSRGLEPGSTAAISMLPSPDAIACCIALMKLGCPVLFLSPAFPAARVHFLCRSASPKLFLHTGDAPHSGDGTFPPMLALDGLGDCKGFDPGNFNGAPALDSPAALFHTSGSAGNPKTVQVLHRGLSALVWRQPYIQFGPGDVVAQLSDPAFDAASFEIWGSLCLGAALALVPGGQRLPPADLAKELSRFGVTAAFFTTSYFHLLARQAPNALNMLSHVYTGGEALNIEAARQVRRAGGPANLWNMYGPTETTTFATGFRIDDQLQGLDCVPIGVPINHYRVRVLDAELREVPTGRRGELFIGGAGVSGGYLGDPQANAEKFIPDPGMPGEKLYRTGDIVSFANDGNLLFHGRLDNQVKIHGYRIELGEIESAILAIPGVHSAAVIVKNLPAGPLLVAFASPASLPASGIQESLRKILPSFMLPKHICLVGEIPLNQNGKIDRSALERIPLELAKRNPEPPVGDLEPALLSIWQRVLRIPNLGVLDQFGDVGGDSLSGAELLAEIESATGVKLPLGTLLRHECVRDLARLIESNDPIPGCESVVYLGGGGNLAPIFLVGGGGAHLLYLKKLASHLAAEHPVFGITLRGETGSNQGWRRIEDYAAEKLPKLLEIQPQGPFLVAGHSLGGLVALELALRLRNEGRDVGFLGLLDTFPPGYRMPKLGLRRALRSNWRLIRVLKPINWLGYFRDQVQMRIARRFRSQQIGSIARIGKQSIRLSHQMSHDLYEPPPYQEPVCIFESREALGSAVGAQARWQSIAPGAEFIGVPGNHWTMLQEPNVELLAHQIRNRIHQTPSGMDSP